MLGALRLAELQVANVRRALVVEGRAAGFSWAEVGSALGVSGAEAESRYAR